MILTPCFYFGNFHMKNSVIVYAKRTALGKLGGALSSTPATELGASLVQDARTSLGLDSNAVDEIIMGQVLTAGCGQSPAKQVALKGGLPSSVRALTINRVCGSGLKSVMLAHNAISLGQAKIVFAGGMENMSLAPHLLPGSRSGFKYGSVTMLDHMAYDGLTNPYDGKPMGCFGDLCAQEFKISREEQDAYALESYRRSQKHSDNGYFKKEILPFIVKSKKTEILVDKDEEPFNAQLEKISSLRPAFSDTGTVTAANASSINDGGALLVLMEEEYAKQQGYQVLARIIAQDSFSGEPKWFTTAPAHSIKNLLNRSNLRAADIFQYEINEAFSVVPLMAMKELHLDHSRVNPYGGAVSMGHPIGASGARILVTLVHGLLSENSSRYGLASICIGGGEASSLLIKKG